MSIISWTEMLMIGFGKETFFLVLSITQWPLILIGAKNNCVYFRFPIILTSVQWKEEQSLFDTIHLFAALEMTWHDKNQKKEAKENHPPHQTLHICTRGRQLTLDGARRNYPWHHYSAMFTQETQEIIELCISGLYTMTLRQ